MDSLERNVDRLSRVAWDAKKTFVHVIYESDEPA